MVMNDMTGDGKWGAPIPIVDGKRPEWLEDNEVITGVYPADFYIKPGTVDPAKSWAWDRVISIRLPADHPHYRQTQTIDWSAPIEALYEGEWVPVHVAEHDTRKETQYPYRLEYGPFTDQWFTADGKHCISSETIRNVQPATQTQTLTAQEHLERLEAFVRKLEKGFYLPHVNDKGMTYAEAVDEARALVAEMEPVVDGDVLIAREMRLEEAGEHASEAYKGYMNGGHYDNDDDVQKFVRAIKRGRELERESGK